MNNIDPAVFQKTQARYHLIRELAHDPLNFGRLMIGREWFRVASPAFHLDIIREYLNPETRRLNIIAPRGHAKCLRHDTLVQMADGSRVPISNVEVGDFVVSVNLKTMGWTMRQITAKEASGIKELLKITLSNKQTIFATKEHRLLTEYGYKEASNLKANIHHLARPLLDQNDTIIWERIVSIENAEPAETFDIQVNGYENFIANGIVSHNSTIVAGLLPLHHILCKTDPNEKRFVVLISKTQAQAERLLNTIKEQLNDNTRIHSTFGDYGEKTAKKWTDKFVVLKDDTALLALGAGMQARGLKHGSQRPTLIIGDDLEDENNTKTAEAMEANLGWWLKAIIPAIDQQRGRIFLVGTPLHHRCLVLTVKELSEWKTYHYSAEADPVNQISLWPEHLPWDQLMIMKAGLESIGRASFYYQEYCCAVIADETRLFKPEYINFYAGSFDPSTASITYSLCDDRGVPVGDTITESVKVFTGIDPATSTGDRADYTVILNLGVTPSGKLIILDYIRRRMSPHETIETVIANYRKYRSVRTSIETTGAQEIFRDFLSKSNVFIPGISVKHTPKDRKEKRHLELLEPYFRSKKFYLLPSHRDLLDELKLWPKAKHDDILDALYYAVLHITPNRSANPTKKQTHEEDPYSSKHSYLLS